MIVDVLLIPGTPDQTFPLLLDTSSKDTWVAGIMVLWYTCFQSIPLTKTRRIV